MPGRDGKGPKKECAGHARGCGCGCGHGKGRGFAADEIPCEKRKEMLTEHKTVLQDRIRNIDEQLEKL